MNSLALLKSYFTNRKNRMRLGNTCGEWKAVKSGRSQSGSVLWNFYQNDLFLWKHSISTECLRWQPPNIYFEWEDWQCHQQSWGGWNTTGRHENIQSQLSAYADNHQIYISGEKIDNIMNSLEEDGNTTGRRYKSNYLSGNPSRTGYVAGS